MSAPTPAEKKDALLGPDDVVGGLPQLPAAPAILPKVMQLLADANCPLDDVADLLKTDQGLAARILILANSAYYGWGARCTSVDEAIKRVGFREIYALVAYAASAQMILRSNKTYGLEAADMWRLSVTGAIAAERLAARSALDSKAAYTIGLLHCAGLVVFDLWRIKQGAPWSFKMKGFPDDGSVEEKELFGFNNAAVAAALLKHWGFPADIIEPIRWQYTPTLAGYHQETACLLHVAKWLRDAAPATDEESLPPQPSEAILGGLGLLPEDLRMLRTDVNDAYARTISLHRTLRPSR